MAQHGLPTTLYIIAESVCDECSGDGENDLHDRCPLCDGLGERMHKLEVRVIEAPSVDGELLLAVQL